MVPFLVLSRTNLAGKRRNPFRIRFYANSPRKSFRIRFYAKHRGVGASPLADATRPSHRLCSPLCFHVVTNHFSRKSFVFKSIQNPKGVWRATLPFRPFAISHRCAALPSPKSLIPAAPMSGLCLGPPSTGSFTVTNFDSKTWDMLRLISRGGPALCSVAATNACNARARVSLANEELIVRAE
jgi:hypothetical protein